MFWPCETRTSTCRNLATISSGLSRFLAITVLLDVKDIPQVGPLQWGRISGAFRDADDVRRPTIDQEHDGKPGLLDCRPEPVGGAVRGPPFDPHAEHPGLFFPCRQERSRSRIFQWDAAHDGEAIRVSFGRFKTIIVSIARPVRRHDDGAIDPGL